MKDPTCTDSTATIGRTLAAARNNVAPNVVVKNPGTVLDASCGIMRATYSSRVPQEHQFKTLGDIHIFMPGDGGSLRITPQADDDGPRITVLRGHQIFIVPAGRRYALHCQRQSELIVIMLDGSYFEQQAVGVLGCLRPQLVEPHAAVDPLLKTMGTCLRNQFQMRRIPGAIYLEFLAGVIAIHLAKNYVCDELAMSDHVVPDRIWLPAHKLDRVEAFIEKHFAEAITVEQVAAE